MYSVIDVMDKLGMPPDRPGDNATRLAIDNDSFEQSRGFGLPP